VNPFAELMRKLRLKRGLRQSDLAGLLGCGKHIVVAIENGGGRGVRVDLAARMSEALSLTSEERLELEEAVRRSQRVYSIPDGAAVPAYEMVRELFDRIDRLTALEIDAIRLVLKLHSDREPASGASSPRLVRRDKVWRNNAVP